MSELIRGAGGGGGQPQQVTQQVIVQAPQRTPVRDPDSLASKQHATFVDLLSEGEIEGFPSARAYARDSANYNIALLKDIYLNETPILSAAANPASVQSSDYNFNGVTVVPRYGTQDQSYISAFVGTEDEKPVNVEVTAASSVTRTITDTNVDRVRVTITVPRLERYTDEGDVYGTSVQLRIAVQYNGGGFTTIIDDTISGRTADQYQRDYLVTLSGAFPAAIRVVRVTADSTSAQLLNKTYWSSYTEIIDEKLRYPNSALVALRLDAEQFSSIPKRAYRIRGLKVRIPNGVTVDQTNGRIIYPANFVWDGTFAAAQWCSDPAWVLWDLLTSTRYGFGDHIQAAQLDKWAFLSASKYASALVPDGFGGQEPRFSCNALIQQADEAYRLINDLCSCMRVMPYWSTGSLTISQDKPADSSYLFTLANVSEEGFSYSGSSIKTRHTVAVVSYLDLETRQLAYESVEDQAGIAKYGVIKTEVRAFACTSRGQAHRLGEWLLYSEQYETEVISFTASIEAGVLVRPGQVIEVSDPMRAGVRRGGRIKAATTTTVTVDDTANTNLESGASPTLAVVLPDGTVESRAVTARSGAIFTVSPAFSQAPQTNSVWIYETANLQTSTWRVLSVEEQEEAKYKINALAYNSGKFDYIERGVPLQSRNITQLTARPDAPSNLQGQELLYEMNDRVLSKLRVSWRPVVGVSLYRINWRQAGGNWSSAIVESPEYEILETAPAVYSIEVYSLNSIRQPSTQPAALSFTVYGRTAPPADVTGVSLVPIDQASAILSWDLAPDLDVRIGGKVLIRHTPALVSATWDQSNDIVPSAAGSQTQKQVPLLSGTYLLRFEDSSGVRSVGSTTIVANLPTPQARLLVQQYAEDQLTPTPFAGTKTNMSYDATLDGLILNSSGGSVLSSGEYAFSTTLDLGATYDANLLRRFTSRAFLPNGLWDSKPGLIDDWPAIDEDNLDGVNATLYVRATTDNPSSTPTWGDWREFANAILRGRGFQFKLLATSSDPSQNIVIDELGAIIELQQRIEQSSQLTSGAATYSATFPNAFYQAPSVGVTAYNMATGDYFEIASVTRTGFQVTFRNSAGTAVSRNFTYTAIGFGRQV